MREEMHSRNERSGALAAWIWGSLFDVKAFLCVV